MARPSSPKVRSGVFIFGILLFSAGFAFFLPYALATVYQAGITAYAPPVLDKAAYDRRMLALAHIDIASTTLRADLSALRSASTTASTTLAALLVATTTATTSVSVEGRRWPAPAAYPAYAALLPDNRIVAYYGNFYSKQMGVLGQYEPEEMLARLASTSEAWQAADPGTHVIPALDYIAVVAQAAPGADGTYRARMPADQIEKAIALAKEVHGIVVLDIQVGKSTLQQELPPLAPYLALPQVHLAIDPEFSIKTNSRPGLEIGTMNSSDINYAASFLAGLVDQYHLPPKILVVHRFTKDMVTGYQNIKPLPEVQVVMDMDGFGTQARKYNTYNYIVAAEPVQFTGFKLFYKNDIPPRGDVLMTPAQVIALTPSPVFIQYQ